MFCDTWNQEYAAWLYEYQNADIPMGNPVRVDWEHLDLAEIFDNA